MFSFTITLKVVRGNLRVDEKPQEARNAVSNARELSEKKNEKIIQIVFSLYSRSIFPPSFCGNVNSQFMPVIDFSAFYRFKPWSELT